MTTIAPQRVSTAAIEGVAAVVGSVAVGIALVVIWASRLMVPRELYVSELGAEGEPTAAAFEIALLLIVGGGSAVAWSARRVRAWPPLLSVGSPALSLWVGCGFFLIASQVTCTSGCPLPYGPSFTWQDFTHTMAAVIAFAAACWAMIQTSFAREHRVLARMSLITAVAVAVIAGTGGLFSLFRFQVVLGSRLEFVATTIAIAWLIILGTVIAARALSRNARE
ncbi:DUF998 domain-containing protein [Salinibacterium sp. SWN248]|uniref:DUF998 domain-containing protein n=1 Tax=Salinibacterium sp. SWN248 TaxID=2792056 RepID=UPI0018CEF314|nr:DUF998 domain-containing protein [Salinibacterium sp. SWN248]MBH0024933.1 DUF998 domain-containing protein [Salinibacterium sp. SWN248]